MAELFFQHLPQMLIMFIVNFFHCKLCSSCVECVYIQSNKLNQSFSREAEIIMTIIINNLGVAHVLGVLNLVA